MAAAVSGPAGRRDGPVPHRPWSTVFLVTHAVAGALGLLAIGGAVLVVRLTLLNQPGPDHEGINEPYGLVIGAVLAVVGIPLAVAQGVLALLAWPAFGGLPGLVAGVPVFGVYAAPGVGLLLGMRSG